MHQGTLDTESPVPVAGPTAASDRDRRDADPRGELLTQRYGVAAPSRVRPFP